MRLRSPSEALPLRSPLSLPLPSSPSPSPSSSPPTIDTPPPPAPPPLPNEAVLLHRARALAKDDPRAALKLLDQHERRFARGMLVQERELLAVELLQALAREDEARARLQAFRRRFPDSIYLRRERAPR